MLSKTCQQYTVTSSCHQFIRFERWLKEFIYIKYTADVVAGFPTSGRQNSGCESTNTRPAHSFSSCADGENLILYFTFVGCHCKQKNNEFMHYRQ